MKPEEPKDKEKDKKTFLDEKSMKSLGVSAAAHLVLLVVVYILMMPAGGVEGDDIIEVSFESVAEESAEETSSDSSEEYQPDLLDNIDEIENQIDEPIEDGYSEKEYIENQYKKLQKKEQEARKAANSIGQNIKKRSKYGPLTPRMFYGVRIYARSVIFVLDISGSMNIQEAKLQLKNAYHSLKGGENFNIIVYSDAARSWKGEVVAATEENQEEADLWLYRVRSRGGTNMYDGLRMAFETAREEQDTIIFLSDGHPNKGPITEPKALLAKVVQWNLSKNIPVHTIGIGSHQVEAFMEALAAQNNGVYHKR